MGQRVEVFQADTADNSLAIHLYSGDAGPVANLKGRTKASLVCRITRVEGGRVYFDRPLRCDLNSLCKNSKIAFWKSEKRVVGTLAVRKSASYPKLGGRFFDSIPRSGVFTQAVKPAWRPQIRSFEPTVTESGVENLCFEFPNTPYQGHFTELGYNAIALNGATDCWVRNVRAVNESLFTDLDAGAGTRLWRCDGRADLGKHCGARGTFWNVRSVRLLSYPPADFGPPSMNFIVLETTQFSKTSPDGKWFEAIRPADIRPQDLHEAQLQRRLRGRTQTSE